MEKNHIIGFILIFATLLLYTMMNAPSEAELAERKRVQDSIAMAQQVIEPIANEEDEVYAVPATKNDTTTTDTTTITSIEEAKEEIVSLENDKIKVDFSTKGGFITNVLLKDYKNSYHPDKELSKEEMSTINYLNDERNKFFIQLPATDGSTYKTNKVLFTPSKQGNSLEMRGLLPNGKEVAFRYKLGEDYAMDYAVDIGNMNLDGEAELIWRNYMPKLERGDFFEQRYTSVYFKETEEDDPDYCSCTSDDIEEMRGEQLDWVSHSNQFFNATLSARTKPFSGGVQETEMIDLEGSDDLKVLQSQLTMDFATSESYQMEMYIGPNDFDRLKAFDDGLEQIIPYGTSIFGSINRYVVRPFFNLLSGIFSNKGIAILIMIFIIKMALYPLLYKMLYSQAKMGALKPELAGLKTKFKDNPQKIQMESMKIYQEYGVSPLSGCLPMIIQMPIWIALYRFFPANIDFRQESFLWSNDLSSYDAFFNLPFEIPFMGSHLSLFTILWAIATVIYTYYNSKHMDMSANPAMKYVQYFMPLMFLGFFNSYASGLTAYMFFSTLINIIQVLITKNFIFDEEKIRKELMVQKAKPKKRSAWQERLQEAMKQQQQIQAQKKKK